MVVKQSCAWVAVLYLASVGWADSLELKNGSRINGKFMGGTKSEVSFQVGNTVQKYDLADIVSLKFGSEISETGMSSRPSSSHFNDTPTAESAQASAHVSIPAG